MKTLSLVLSILLGGIIAFSLGCASEWKCPKAPKVVAKFSVGDKVAFTRGWTVWSARSNPQSFWVEKGDTGAVTDIAYFDTFIRYEVSLDKAKRGEIMLSHGYDGIINSHEHHDLEAVVYPDPALAPRK
jgi:hypothetical protein